MRGPFHCDLMLTYILCWHSVVESSGTCRINATKTLSFVDHLDIFYTVTVTEEVHCLLRSTAGKERIKGYENTGINKP